MYLGIFNFCIAAANVALNEAGKIRISLKGR
jgi:hypothetical protein